VSLAACGQSWLTDENASARRPVVESPWTPGASPSPLNGERAGVRGEGFRTAFDRNKERSTFNAQRPRVWAAAVRSLGSSMLKVEGWMFLRFGA
jgi:hypothetical protein